MQTGRLGQRLQAVGRPDAGSVRLEAQSRNKPQLEAKLKLPLPRYPRTRNQTLAAALRPRLGSSLAQPPDPELVNLLTGRSHSSGAIEGMNCNAKLALRKAYGFRPCNSYELPL